MYLCDSGHEEVCYEYTDCPVCMALEKIEELEKEINNLKEELNNA